MYSESGVGSLRKTGSKEAPAIHCGVSAAVCQSYLYPMGYVRDDALFYGYHTGSVDDLFMESSGKSVLPCDFVRRGTAGDYCVYDVVHYVRIGASALVDRSL